MNLANPGAGDITDRLTILALKRLYGEAEGKDVAHFKNESVTLLVKIRSRTLNGAWFDGVLALAAVNAALWHAEDALREIRSRNQTPGAMEQAGQIGCRIQGLNDQRAALVADINKVAGDGEAKDKL